ESAQGLLDQHGSGGKATGVQHKVVQRHAVQRQVPPEPAAPAAGGAGAGTPLDRLRAAVRAQNTSDIQSAYGSLQAADKVVVAHDVHLVTDMVRLLDPSVALSILTELALPRATLLQVASAGKPGDAVFLGEVLALAGLNNLTALGASAGELRRFPAFLTRAVIDPIVNAGSASAMAQLQLASTPPGQALLEAVYPGQLPTECLTKLGADLGVVRGGFQTSPSFRRWMLTKPAVLGMAITRTPDGFAWARLLWSSPDAAVLLGWVIAYTAFWGTAIGDGLLSSGTAADGAALRANRSLASAVFRAIAQAHAAAGLVQVFAKIHFTLAEQVKALHDAGILDAASLQLVLNGAGVTVADQEALTRDAAVIAMIQPLVAGQRADQVLSILAGNQVQFCHAVAAKNSFTTWVTNNQAQLTATMNALPNWGAWIDTFRTMNAWDLLLRLAGDATLKANLRTGIIAKTAWNWLVRAVPHPVSTQAQAAAILDLYGDGSGISLADKYLTWTALYRTPLSRAGHDHTYTWHDDFLNTTKYEKRYFAVDPNDDAMNLFFHSFRQLPRAHIDTASGVVMVNFYHIKSNPLIGSNKFWNDNNNPWTQMASPGQLGLGTSYYMGDNWIIMQATGTTGAVGAAGSRGAADTSRLTTFGGAASAVNTPGTDPLSPTTPAAMTRFQNHATHEVGHAIGARKLKHGAYNVAGDDWTRTWGNWAQDGSANGYATMCGWTAAMDTTNYTLNDGAGVTTTIAGAKIKAFLTGIISGGLTSQSGHPLVAKFGSAAAAVLVLKGDGTLGSHLLVQNVFQLAVGGADLPDKAYIIPAGIAAGQSKVHFFATRWDNKWVTYDAVCWHHKVSHYGVSSYKEMFAELYVAKFSGATMPPNNNGMNPVDFFNALQQADPKELGLPAYGKSKATPGQAAEQGVGAGPGASAGAAPPQAEQPHNPADDMPASARGTPL
ncbi:MAG TPA: hypothetical protein VK607_14860, partial [Kofleriaceae bacterium]|nr:hypothetical protein [Kofleriaceae bacterium]